MATASGGYAFTVTSFRALPESREAADELDPVAADLPGPEGGDWLEALERLAQQAVEVVPDLVGVSVARVQDGLTFTVVASDVEVAVLDAVQYVHDGPCVEAARSLERTQYHESDVLDEERWALFARANAVRGIRSTLTLPVLGAGQGHERVVGTVNLYARSSAAFAGRADQLAEVFGAYAAGAIADADLAFRTREEAVRAPGQVRDQVLVETAAGLLTWELGVEVDEARDLLRSAAFQAGVDVTSVAREVIAASRREDPGPAGP